MQILKTVLALVILVPYSVAAMILLSQIAYEMNNHNFKWGTIFSIILNSIWLISLADITAVFLRN